MNLVKPLILFLGLLVFASAAADSINFDLLVTSDTHDAIGGGNLPGHADWGQYISFCQGYVKKYPHRNILNLHSGDLLEGRASNNPTSTYKAPGQGIIAAMANSGYSDIIFTAGNHDIDTKASTVYYMKTFDDPDSFWKHNFITANVIRKDTGKVYGTDPWTSRKFKTTNGDDFNVVILGMMDQTWDYTADTVKIISIQEAFKNAQFESFLAAEKPDLVIVLGHYGGHAYDEDTKMFISNPQTYELGSIIREYTKKDTPLHFLLGHVHVLQSSSCADGDKVLNNCWSYCSDGYFEHSSIVYLNLTKGDGEEVFTVKHDRTTIPTLTDNFAKILNTTSLEETPVGRNISKVLEELNTDTGAFKVIGTNTAGHDWIYPTPTNGLGAWEYNSLVRLFFDKVYPNVYKDVGNPDLYILNSGTFKSNLYKNIDKDQVDGIYPYTELPVVVELSPEALYYCVHTSNPPAELPMSEWSNTPAVKGNPIVNKFNYYFVSTNFSQLESGKLYRVGCSNFDISNVVNAACKDNKCGKTTTYSKYELKGMIDDYVVNKLYPLQAAVSTPEVNHSSSSKPGYEMSAGGITMIVIVVALAIICAGFCTYWFGIRKCKQKKQDKSQVQV